MPETAATHTATAAPPACAWSQTYPALPSHVSDARRFLAAILNASPLTGDALICLSEIATNAVLHSNSRHPGGTFTVRVSLRESTLRVEAEDVGGPWARECDHGGQGGQGGRGLLIVSQLATTWGITCDGATGRTVWFEMTQP